MSNPTQANQPPKPSTPPFQLFPYLYWAVFLIAVPLGALLMLKKEKAQVPVLTHDVPAYHVLQDTDFALKPLDQLNRTQIVTDTVRNMEDLQQHYTLTALALGSPLRKTQLGRLPDGVSIADTYAVGISVSNSTLLGGNLSAGDIVSISTGPPTSTEGGTRGAPALVLPSVLVLDVRYAADEKIVVLALPAEKERWLGYLAETSGKTLVLTRKVK
jgi:Flp pilus assembly protein CpaB